MLFDTPPPSPPPVPWPFHDPTPTAGGSDDLYRRSEITRRQIMQTYPQHFRPQQYRGSHAGLPEPYDTRRGRAGPEPRSYLDREDMRYGSYHPEETRDTSATLMVTLDSG